MTVQERFQQNQRLTTYVLRKSFPNLTLDEDIYQEAYLGLWKACIAFDDTKGFEFSTFAVTTIRNIIVSYIKRQAKNIVTLSLDEPMPDTEGATLAEFIVDPNTLDGIKANTIKGYFEDNYDGTLSQRQRRIIRRLYAGKTQAEIGNELGVAQSTINREISIMRKGLMGG